MLNKDTNELMSINHNGSLQKLKEQPPPENKGLVVKKNTYVKEKFNVSDKACHELLMIHPPLPCWSTINKAAKEIDSHCDIFPTPGSIIGVQQSLRK